MPGIKPKGLAEILAENQSLTQKYTYDDYEAGMTVPQNSDETIAEAYENYRKVKLGEA
ncbi:MAG: hypothetical protein K2O32_12030 [Acetatifactor sp.]|nr:hypothetical protein [Acetatifactor sp.]